MKISTSRRSITPIVPYFPCYLCGHAMRVDPAIGIKDDLWASAMRIELDGSTLVFVSIELVGYTQSASDLIKQEVHDKYGVPNENTIIGFVHTHSAPEYSYDSPFGSGNHGAVNGYPEYIHDQIIHAIDDCFMVEPMDVTVKTRQVTIDGYYGSRNAKDGASDKRIMTIEFFHANHLVASWLNMTCHPTVLGPQNFYVSADLAGALSRGYQQRYGVYPLFMQGAAGDISNRLYRQGNDYAELLRVSQGILDQWDEHASAPQDITIDHLDHRHYSFHQTYHPDLTLKAQRVKDIEAKIESATTFDQKKVYTSALAVAKSNVDVAEYTLDLQADLWKMDDVFILTIPAELFNQFGVAIKNAMGVDCPIIWGYTNYSVGYLVDQAEYGRSFESACSDIPAGTTEKIVDEIITMIKTMKEEKDHE